MKPLHPIHQVMIAARIRKFATYLQLQRRPMYKNTGKLKLLQHNKTSYILSFVHFTFFPYTK